MLFTFTAGFLSAAALFVSPTGEQLHDVPLEVLEEILADAGEPTARVSSYERTAQKQAALMYGICERDGVAKAKRLYSKKSHGIIDAFVDNQGSAEAEVVAAMTKAVRAVLAALGPKRRTMMHVDSANYTFDIAPSSLKSPAKFRAALRRHPDVVRYFVPGGAERAFHIEVSREQQPLLGVWNGRCDDGTTANLFLGFSGDGWTARFSRGLGAPVAAKVKLDKKAKTITVTAGSTSMTGGLSMGYTQVTLASAHAACVFERP